MRKIEDEVPMMCCGDAIIPWENKCSVSLFHICKREGDAMPYNGIKNWRCKVCFDSHRQKVRQLKVKD